MAGNSSAYVSLPGGGKMPLIGLGTWQGSLEFEDEEAVVKNVETAIEIGYRHIDTAQMYKTEEAVGKALASVISQGKIKRDDIFVTTKLWATHHLRSDVTRHLRKSLERLKLDRVDLFLIHWPCSLKPDEKSIIPTDSDGNVIYANDIDFLDTWKGMEDAVDQGLTKYIGLSNFNKRQIERILSNCRIRPVNNQVEVSLYFQNLKLVDFCRSVGISVTGYRSLQFLNASSSAEAPDKAIVEAIASRLDKTVQQVALRYQIQQGIIVLPKSGNAIRLRQNYEALNFDLSDADMSTLRNVDTGKRSLDFLFLESKEYPFSCRDPY